MFRNKENTAYAEPLVKAEVDVALIHTNAMLSNRIKNGATVVTP
jgi:hypothetical protein